jgi:hypothetical protein
MAKQDSSQESNSDNEDESEDGETDTRQRIHKSHLTANVICKLTMQRGLLFDIQSRRIEQAFSQIKIPDGVKAKSSLILTSSEQMFLIGGEEKGVYTGNNYEFSLASQTFTEKKPMPEPRVEFGCIYYGGCVYAVGGWREFYIRRADRYNIQEDTWYDMPSLKEEREGVSLCIVEDKYLFAIGTITTRGKRLKIPKKGAVELSFERLNLMDKSGQSEWEQIIVKTDIN